LGVDFAARTDTPVFSTASGVVIEVKTDHFFGLTIILDHGNGLQTLYAHLQRSLVGRLQTVRKNQAIATVGSSGMAIGPHLHYEVWKNNSPVDPELFFLGPFSTPASLIAAFQKPN
jgi:murein DD-endopeptidase MepM/ murein hydrolase activator NlpD